MISHTIESHLKNRKVYLISWTPTSTLVNLKVDQSILLPELVEI